MITIHMSTQPHLSDTTKKISKYPADDILHIIAKEIFLPLVVGPHLDQLPNWRVSYEILPH